MAEELKRLPAYFYRSGSGREPVREWLQGLKPEDRKILGEDIKYVEFAWPIGMPAVRSLGEEGVWPTLYAAVRQDQADAAFIRGFVDVAKQTCFDSLMGIVTAEVA